MAQIIDTFLYKNSRYFQIWNTYYECPETVPINLLNLLQIIDISNKSKIEVIYSLYPRLIKNGTTISTGSSYNLPHYLQKLSFSYLDISSDNYNEDELKLNEELEKLFLSDLKFNQFYKEFSTLIHGINQNSKRPLMYYLSWSETFKYFDQNNSKINDITNEILKTNNISCYDNNRESNNNLLNKWLTSDSFFKHNSALAELFYQLVINNLISINSIPHILRENELIKHLYCEFGMENFIPSYTLRYDIYDSTPLKLKNYSHIKYKRQFINLSCFSNFCQKINGNIRLLELSNDRLSEIIEDVFSINNFKIVNLTDGYNNYKLPMIYINSFEYLNSSNFFILGQTDQITSEIYTKNGRFIDKGEYCDFHFIDENTAYIQQIDNKWIRWSFDQSNGKLSKNAINSEVNFESINWVYFEKSLKDSTIDVKNLELGHVVKISFNKSHSLILLSTLTNTKISEVKNEINNHLYKLLTKKLDNVNLSMLDVELCKSIINFNNLSLQPLDFDSVVLTIYKDDVKIGFDSNENKLFRDFFENNRISIDRPIHSFIALKIIAKSYDDAISFEEIKYFYLNGSVDEFVVLCKHFINDNNILLMIKNEFIEKLTHFLTKLGYTPAIQLDFSIDDYLSNFEENQKIDESKKPDSISKYNNDFELPF